MFYLATAVLFLWIGTKIQELKQLYELYRFEKLANKVVFEEWEGGGYSDRRVSRFAGRGENVSYDQESFDRNKERAESLR
jgi:hypothetical protein